MNKNPLKLIIFDLDGTLVDAYDAVKVSLNFAFRKLKLPVIDHETVKKNVGWGDKNLICRLVPGELASKALSLYRRHHSVALRSKVKFLPGAKAAILDFKRKRYQLAIASNRPTRFTNLILRTLNVKPYFDIILCADKVSRPKPSGDILRAIIRTAGLSKKQVLYVGDMFIDVQAGNDAGIRTIAVTTGSSTRERIKKEKPFMIFRNMPEVRSFIGRRS